MVSTTRHKTPRQAAGLVLVLCLGLTGPGCGNKGPRESTSQGVMAALDNRGTDPVGAGRGLSNQASPANGASDASETSRESNPGEESRHRGPAMEPPLDVSAPPDDARLSELGVYNKTIDKGRSQRSPTQDEIALVHYSSWRTSGELIYSTGKDGRPQTMPISLAPPGWRELLLDMREGERRMVWMPSHLATSYTGGLQEVLVMVVDLVAIEPAPEKPTHLHAAPADANKTESGLAYRVLEPGDGTETPSPWDRVSVEYTVWSEDGIILDTTITRSTPTQLQPFRQSSGWAEAMQLLVEGRRTRFWVPEALRTPLRQGDPGGMQVVDMAMVDLEKLPAPPTVPADVAAPPRDAKQTEKGVYYVVLEPGTGKRTPTPRSQVKVHYTGWTTDGQMFDSSVVRGKPTIFPLNAVIEGWTDVLQIMVEGQKSRVWIPEELAYQGKPGRPQGMLVFDIELIAIDPNADADAAKK